MLIDKPSGALYYATASSSSGEGVYRIRLKHPKVKVNLKSKVTKWIHARGLSSARPKIKK